MSVIEDSRKVMQDFLAPELRAISARLEALEKRHDESVHSVDKRFDAVDKRFDSVDKRFDRVDKRLDSMDQAADKRHEAVLSAIAKLSEFNESRIDDLRERVIRLEVMRESRQ